MGGVEVGGWQGTEVGAKVQYTALIWPCGPAGVWISTERGAVLGMQLSRTYTWLKTHSGFYLRREENSSSFNNSPSSGSQEFHRLPCLCLLLCHPWYLDIRWLWSAVTGKFLDMLCTLSNGPEPLQLTSLLYGIATTDTASNTLGIEFLSGVASVWRYLGKSRPLWNTAPPTDVGSIYMMFIYFKTSTA